MEPCEGLRHLTQVTVNDEVASRIRNGQRVRIADPGSASEALVAVTCGSDLLAMATLDEGVLRPEEGFPGMSDVQWAYPPGIPRDRGTVATVGTFDGVHRGHWTVLREIRERADATDRRSVLVTFDPHPLRIVRPEHAPLMLTTPVEKKEILAESGLDYAVFISFTEALSRYEPRRFVEEILVERLRVEELVIGYDHGFGRDRAGRRRRRCRAIGVGAGFHRGRRGAAGLRRRCTAAISSTRIRETLLQVAEGRMAEADRVAWGGRTRFRGVVVQRGRAGADGTGVPDGEPPA